MLCVYTASNSSKSQSRITSLSSSQRGKRLTQGCNHRCLKKAFSSVFKHVQTRHDSLYNRGAGKVGKCHSCGLIKDLSVDLTNAVWVVPSGSCICEWRRGREDRGIPRRVERVWDSKDGVWQLFTANTILAHGYVFQPRWKITSK